jgi:hypothetical protein
MKSDNKLIELKKTRDILLATVDYYIDLYSNLKNKDKFLPIIDHFRKIRNQTNEHFEKGRSVKLKQWLKDLTEMPRETNDFNYVLYIKQKTGYDFNIFEDFEKRVNKILEKSKISTDNQYREVLSKVDSLCQTDPRDEEKIKSINELLIEYDKVKLNKKS